MGGAPDSVRLRTLRNYHGIPVLFPTFLEKRYGGHACDCGSRLPRPMNPVDLAGTSVDLDCDEPVLHPCIKKCSFLFDGCVLI